LPEETLRQYLLFTIILSKIFALAQQIFQQDRNTIFHLLTAAFFQRLLTLVRIAALSKNFI